MDRKQFNEEGHIIVSGLYDASMRLHNLMAEVQGTTDTLTSEWWTLNSASKALGSAIDTLSLLTGYAVGAKGRPSAFPGCQTEMAENRDGND